MSEFPVTDIYDRVLYLGVPPEEFVLAGSAAVEAAVGPAARRAADLDVAVGEATYRQLRERSDLQEHTLPNGYRHLTGDGYDISVGWGGRSVEELQRRGYRHRGVHVVGLPDVYAHKQDRGLPKDVEDVELIRDRLYGDKPMPTAMLGGELAFVQSFMPERLHDRPELLVAANGLLIVRTVFGHAKEGVRTYTGTYETMPVPATYHEWEHSAYGARDGQRSMDLEEAVRKRRGLPPKYSDDDRVAHAAGFTNHDARLGGGRRADNPDGHDERRSAELAVRHLAAVGASDYVQQGAHATVMVTTFNEKKKAQDFDLPRGFIHLQEKGAGSDMASHRRPSPLPSLALIPEDLSREGAGYDQPLARLVDQLNSNLPPGAEPVRIRSAVDGLRLIMEHPDFPVTVAGNPPVRMTLLQACVRHIRSSRNFRAGYRFSGMWGIGTPEIQAEGARELGLLADRLEQGDMGALDPYLAALASPEASTETTIYDPVLYDGETTNGQSGSIAGVRAALYDALGVLPAGEVAAAGVALDRAAEIIRSALGSAANQHGVGVVEAAKGARDLLERVHHAIGVVVSELARYDRDLG